MRNISYSGQFKKDLEKVRRQGKNIEKLKTVLQLLIEGKKLPRSLGDHPLKGNWNGYRDLHIDPDWVLIYKLGEAEIRFERTGTHAELF